MVRVNDEGDGTDVPGDAATIRTMLAQTLPLLLLARAAAALLGVSRATFYRWDKGGLIPSATRIRGRRRWSRIELGRWLAQGCPSRQRWEVVR